jgi:hypothetical protein
MTGGAVTPVGLENGIEGRSLVWLLDYPGCFCYGATGAEALDRLPPAVEAYREWLAAHGQEGWLPAEVQEFDVVDAWQVYCINEAYEIVEQGDEINAWFRHDWKPLTEREVERGLALLDWTRADLLAAVQGLSDADMDTLLPDQHWSIRGILGHVGGAEWWYLDRLRLALPRALVPEDPFERLRVVRIHMRETLSRSAGSREVVGTEGEFWSPRKMLRRAVWHERDHTQHIDQLRTVLGR